MNERELRDLITKGWRSTSNKYRLIAKAPEDIIDWFRKNDPQHIARIEESLRDYYRRVHAVKPDEKQMLSEAEYKEFKWIQEERR